MSSQMIPVEQALEMILEHIHVLEPERKSITDCLGQVLAADIHADVDIPPMDNSAMDGFAIRARDLRGASTISPVVLEVIDQVAAGYVSSRMVKPGAAIRIMTGAAMPSGADTVVPFEDTDEVAHAARGEGLSRIGILVETKQGANVRTRGEDIAAGQLALSKGTLLRPAEIGVLASIGVAVVPVVRRPIVAILSTGDELVGIDELLTPGKIRDANSYTTAALVAKYGGIPRVLGIGGDTVDSLNALLDRALDADLLITSGGVSVGDYDMVKDVLSRRGEIHLWTVRMKPGKPSAFGLIRRGAGRPGLPLLGLPGNPVSSMITFEQFVRPAILKTRGVRTLAKPSIRAIMDDPIVNSDNRRVYARVRVRRDADGYHARLTGSQGSAILTSMSKANGLAIVPETADRVRPGDAVEVQMLDWDEGTILEEATP
jgi:molybdopterin molybdotransferase